MNSLDDALRECCRRGIIPICGGTGVETALIIGAVVAVAAAGVGTYMAVEASEQQADLAKAEKKQRESEAQSVQETAAFEEKQHRRRIALLRGKQQAAFAAAGFDTTSGTPLLEEIDLVQQGELEALNIRRAGKISANISQFEANVAGWRGRNAERAIPLQIASGALQAGSGVASSYGDYSYYKQRKTVAGRMYGRSDWE